MILSALLRLCLFDISTRGEGCSCLSRHITAVLFQNPPIRHPVMLLFKKLPVHHRHPPFYVPRPRGKEKERNQPSLKHKLTALSRLTWHQRSDVPDVALNFHNRVTPQLLVTQRDHVAPKTSGNILAFIPKLQIHYGVTTNPLPTSSWEKCSSYKSLFLHQSLAKYSELFCKSLKLNPSPWLHINVILSIREI